ncbi:MAG: HEAT repeat domain-containing protein [Planctomycetota bacterium]|jgi:hypothetical protein
MKSTASVLFLFLFLFLSCATTACREPAVTADAEAENPSAAQDSRPASAPTSRKAKPVAVGEVTVAEAAKDAGRLVKLLEIDHQWEEAARALVRLGKEALPPLIVALDDPRRKVKVRAVQTLGAMGADAKSALPWLEKSAKGADGRLAFPAFQALTRIKFAGRTLIADYSDNRISEVDKAGKIVWQLANMANVHDADRLPNGNTLLTIRMLNLVREVDPSGKTVMEIRDLSAPSDADRLPNGHTIVAENGQIREFDKDGKQVGRIATTWAVEANRY